MYGALARRADFLRVYQRHIRVSGRFFTMLVHPEKTETPSAGLVVSKKVGNAVRRNLVKRRLRAYLREHKELVSMQRDVIIIARLGAAEATWAELCASLDQQWSKASRAISGERPLPVIDRTGDRA